ncbi:MAG: formylglycine-generating enzyme family protein [Armatimonadota bacterium]
MVAVAFILNLALMAGSQKDMVFIPSGTFQMGSSSGLPDEQPVHQVRVSGFWMDRHDVTNQQFESFISATHYKTIAERPLNPKDFPGVPKSKLVPGALVFSDGRGWEYVPGASWRHPQGPNSSIKTKLSHPVVQIAWDDAVAYAKWAGKALPTEAQFEYAARGGKASAKYAWGNEALRTKWPQANTYQGNFPQHNVNTDGFALTSPVGSFPANGYGLFDMSGNVWQWCLDWYRPDAYSHSAKLNPTGPKDSYDPDEPGAKKHVVRGGSFLCADCYCKGYRVTARMKSSADTGLCHTGFRCVINSK